MTTNQKPKPFKPLTLRTHIRVIAGPGVGKSRAMAWTLFCQNFYWELPIVCIDPTEVIVRNIIDQTREEPDDEH